MSEERRYEVLGVLGRGGFGTVYHARFLGEGGFAKEVALKMLNKDVAGVEEIARRLRDEARVLGLVRHRAIVAVDRLTQIDGRWTVVMEYVEGQDLGHLLSAGPLPQGAALEIASEIAGALNAACTRPGLDGQPLNLLHRDLKPSNIRITPYGEIKILDFGIARADFDTREAQTRSLAFGTPEYMSPERLDFSGDSAAGDIYALGAVLFELLVSSPFGRSSANPAKHARRMEGALAALGTADVRDSVQDLVAKMLHFDDSARPTAAEVERNAYDLARQVGGPGLRDWVDRVSDLLSAPAPPADPTAGSILVERTEFAPDTGETRWQRAPPPSTRAPTPRPTPLTPGFTAAQTFELSGTGSDSVATRTPTAPNPVPGAARTGASATGSRGSGARVWGAAVALGVLLILGAVLAAGVRWALRERRGTEGASAAAGPAVPPAESSGASSMERSPQPLPPTEPVDAQSVSETEFTAAVSGTAEEAPEPPAAASDTKRSGASVRSAPGRLVTVLLTGDARQASLRDSPRIYRLPAEVPPGNYSIFVSFEGEPEAAVGKLTVDLNAPVTVHCELGFGKCSAEKVKR